MGWTTTNRGFTTNSGESGQAFGQEAYTKHFDAFMRHYLTFKAGEIPKKSQLYEAFKLFAGKGARSMDHCLQIYMRITIAPALRKRVILDGGRFRDLR